MMKSLRLTLALFAGYSALTIAITYPLAWHLGTRVPHDLGDPLLSVVILWWNAHHLPLSAAWWNGAFFWPAPGALTLSDHRLGESLLASPLQWAGLGPLTAYNITLLSTFPACALAAHWLAFTLTRRHDVSLIAGLAYGFSPYRFAHIEHLELLAAFGMPAALAALHQYLNTRRAAWFAAFVAALLLQALLCSYYVLFFLVMLAVWAVWFGRSRDVLVGLLASVAAVLVLISPIALKYLEVHRQYGLSRGLGDIVTFSADVTSIVTASPLSVIWGWTSVLNGPERQLFPGATILCVVAVACGAALLSGARGARPSAASIVLGAAGCVLAVVAGSAWWFGVWRVGSLSVGTPYKPFSLAFFCWVAAGLTSGRVREAYARRSFFAFYVLAAALLFLFSLGPKPALMHQQILYQPPYAWLMRIGVFGDSVRVPARFAMLAILALSTAASLALARLRTRPAITGLVTALVATAIVADSWISRLPLLEPPPQWPAQVATAGVAASLELPLGDTMGDIAAMYRSILHGVPTANGNSGYLPPHYRTLSFALENRDGTVLEALSARGPVLVAISRADPGAIERIAWLRTDGQATELWGDARADWFLVHGLATPAATPPCGNATLPIAGARDKRGVTPVDPLRDRSDATFWTTGESQRVGDQLILDLGRTARPCSARISLGARPDRYPNALSAATSLDGESWHTSFTGKLGGDTVRAALAHPRDVVLEVPLYDEAARFVRLRIEADQPKTPWVVTELAITSR